MPACNPLCHLVKFAGYGGIACNRDRVHADAADGVHADAPAPADRVGAQNKMSDDCCTEVEHSSSTHTLQSAWLPDR